MADNCSQPSPQPSSVPGLKFSISTSASRTSRRTTSWPSGWRRSSVTLFLLRDCTCHHTLVPSLSKRHLRSGSPSPGGSILMTSAPKSPSVLPQNGPAISWPSSRTLMPARICGVASVVDGVLMMSSVDVISPP